MNTLVIFNQQPPYITNIPSCQRSQPLYSKTLNILPRFKNSWILHAQAKGFGGASNRPSAQEKENKPKLNPSQEEEDDDDKIPDVVFGRMIRRILTSVGVPLVMGVLSLNLFAFLKEKQMWDVPLWVPFITLFVLFGSSVLGVAYGSLSTSLDPEKEGSLLGLEEALQNWEEMWKEEEGKK